jgi:hypothetical protein
MVKHLGVVQVGMSIYQPWHQDFLFSIYDCVSVWKMLVGCYGTDLATIDAKSPSYET